MNLVKIKSDRADKSGRSYTDVYLCWFYREKAYYVRIRPSFTQDYKLLLSNATEIESLDIVEKYM